MGTEGLAQTAIYSKAAPGPVQSSHRRCRGLDADICRGVLALEKSFQVLQLLTFSSRTSFV